MDNKISVQKVDADYDTRRLGSSLSKASKNISTGILGPTGALQSEKTNCSVFVNDRVSKFTR